MNQVFLWFNIFGFNLIQKRRLRGKERSGFAFALEVHKSNRKECWVQAPAQNMKSTQDVLNAGKDAGTTANGLSPTPLLKLAHCAASSAGRQACVKINNM